MALRSLLPFLSRLKSSSPSPSRSSSFFSGALVSRRLPALPPPPPYPLDSRTSISSNICAPSGNRLDQLPLGSEGLSANGSERQRAYHDGRPRGPLWRGKKLIGKEALFVILGMKRFKDDEEKLDKFVKSHVLRLLKMDKVAVLTELERQEEVDLALKMFKIIQKEEWYKPDVYLYKDLIVSLAKCKKMEEAMQVWEDMKKDDLFPDAQTYAEVIRGFLKYGSPADAMNIYEDMKKSPEPPEELPFRILLKGLLPHPLLRNRVKQDFEELFPERHIYDPPEEIFGIR